MTFALKHSDTQATLLKVLGFDEDLVTLQAKETCITHTALLELLGSKAAVRKVFERRQLQRGGEVLVATSKLQPGDTLALRFHRKTECVSAVHESVDVLFCDPILLAADKPAGILVHGDGTGAPTLTARVQAMRAQQGLPTYAQAVQRLDVDTTGIVLFSLTEEFQPKLDAQIAGHDMGKRYLAVIEGRLPKSERDWLELIAPIARDRHNAKRMRASVNGKPALTRVRTIDRKGNLSLLLVELGTGRKHQIRVHLAHVGHPILGDTLYGGANHPDGLMLHACEERLVHPVTGEPLVLRTDTPPRFARLFPR